jgi:hypothetical protein
MVAQHPLFMPEKTATAPAFCGPAGVAMMWCWRDVGDAEWREVLGNFYARLKPANAPLATCGLE